MGRLAPFRVVGRLAPLRVVGRLEPLRVLGRLAPLRLVGRLEPARVVGRFEPARVVGRLAPRHTTRNTSRTHQVRLSQFGLATRRYAGKQTMWIRFPGSTLSLEAVVCGLCCVNIKMAYTAARKEQQPFDRDE